MITLVLPIWLVWLLVFLLSMTLVVNVLRLYSSHLERKLYKLRGEK